MFLERKIEYLSLAEEIFTVNMGVLCFALLSFPFVLVDVGVVAYRDVNAYSQIITSYDTRAVLFARSTDRKV